MDSRSRFKYCAPQLWLFESEGPVVYMNLFPSTQNERKKNPSILWQNPGRISIIWTKNVPELCHCSGRAWSSFAPFPRPLLCFSSSASGGHMQGYESKLEDLHANINYMQALVQRRNPCREKPKGRSGFRKTSFQLQGCLQEVFGIGVIQVVYLQCGGT